MESSAPSPDVARSRRGVVQRARRPVPIASFAIAAVLLCGCGGGGGHRPEANQGLVVGERAAVIAAPRLAPAARLARRFGDAYANSIYRRRVPRLPGETTQLHREIQAAETRVPLGRRGLRSHAARISLSVESDTEVRANLRILDEAGNSFSVAFLVARRGARWRIVSVSSPE